MLSSLSPCLFPIFSTFLAYITNAEKSVGKGILTGFACLLGIAVSFSIYGIFASLLVANLLTFLIGLYGNRVFIKMVCVSDKVLFPLIMVVALIGTYSVNSSLFDVGSCIGFGILGWILKRYGYPAAPVVLGIVLGKLIEYNFRRGVIMGGYTVFFTDTLAFVVLFFAMLSLFYPLIQAGLRRYKKGRLN